MKNIKTLQENKQSLWIDFISRSLLKSGKLKTLIKTRGITGLTSNPSIFEKAISDSNDYDHDILKLLKSNSKISSYKIFEELSIYDIKKAAELLLNTYENTNYLDGYVSIEVSPKLAYKTKETIDQALHLNKKINMPNIMIKVPATDEGIEAIKILTKMGLNINATLMFNQRHYDNVSNAFLEGTTNYSQKLLPFSVASFFVSRVDTEIDSLLETKDKNHKLLGKIAIANSRLAYITFLKKFPNQNKKPLQKPLWGSTSTKNPNYSNSLYIDKLIAPNTINTVPLDTIEKFVKTGNPENYNGWDENKILSELSTLNEIGIDLSKITENLQENGVKLFEISFDNLLNAIESKINKIQTEAI
ncbi:MAG: transaldolase [Chloroflexi bacterium]|jgi:transaldolase|nr:transaldolase [Chloroflexota bacterium]|tara:strand:+ start:3796 stop:4875 length:1080 start_codon:yes stop_codon:yes gene_type:complete